MNNIGPSLTVDCVIFVDESAILIKRAHEPFKGRYALPGGFVEIGETVEQACARELLEETGLIAKNLILVGVYSKPGRDPHRHTVSIAYLAEADLKTLKAGSDALMAELVEDWMNLELAFDHNQIISDAWKLWNSEEVKWED